MKVLVSTTANQNICCKRKTIQARRLAYSSEPTTGFVIAWTQARRVVAVESYFRDGRFNRYEGSKWYKVTEIIIFYQCLTYPYSFIVTVSVLRYTVHEVLLSIWHVAH